MSTLSSRLLNINSMLFNPFIVESVILCEAFGIMQRIKELIPCYESESYKLKCLIISMKMFLSVLLASGSFNPGVSIKVMSPNEPCFTHEVTDSNDSILLNLQP